MSEVGHSEVIISIDELTYKQLATARLKLAEETQSGSKCKRSRTKEALRVLDLLAVC
jgi:hypothetical protein